jgi:hypothetical protein
MFNLPTKNMIVYYWCAWLTQRLFTPFQCMHGSKCKVGSYCTVGRRLQEFNILGGLILPVWGTIEKALAKQVFTSVTYSQIVVLLVILWSWMARFIYIRFAYVIVDLGFLPSLLSCLVLWFSGWRRIFVNDPVKAYTNRDASGPQLSIWFKSTLFYFKKMK